MLPERLFPAGDVTRPPEGPRSHLSLVTDPPRALAPGDPTPPLLPRIAAGDERAVGEVLERYGRLVWSLARRWTPDGDDVEDAVQEIFIDLWRTADRFNDARISEAGWVAMIARRRLIDRTRRRGRRPELEALTDDVDAPVHEPVDREAAIDRASRSEVARAVLMELPASQRRMLELSLLHGRTHDEIARETETPLGTVKSHIRRGIQRARALMASRTPVEPGDA